MIQMSAWRKTCLFAVLAAASTAHAVDVNARIKGSVTDPSGAAVPNVAVTATNQNTGVKFTTTSQPNGDYVFQQLPVGTYTITASAPGFKSFSASDITITIAQEYVEPVTLSVGTTSEVVSVQADAVQINSTDMQLSNVITSRQIEELPLIGRNFTQLELTLPGVQLPDNRFGTLSVSGSQSQQSSYLINGADTNDIALNTVALVPSIDAIDQFNLIDGPLNAEYDRNSGGIVSAAIKQGTNHFHGNGFEFYRDTFLNTNNFFQKAYTNGVRTDKVSAYHQHIFGGTVGGPILKDHLFFFGSYQGTRQRTPGGTTSNVVYSAANLTGDFSNDTFSSNPIPAGVTIPGCVAGQTYASCLGGKGGKLPVTAFNATALKLATTYVPAPNAAANTFTYNSTTTLTQDQYIGRVDFNPNPKNQITVLGIYQKGLTANQLPFSGSTLPGFGDGSLSHIQQWTFDYVRQLNSTTVNDLSAHYTRFNFNSGAPQTVTAPSSAGFAISPQDKSGQTLPTIGILGFFTIGGTNNGPQPRIDQTIQLSENLTKVIGHHNLKFGYDGRRFNVSNSFDASNSGSYSFTPDGAFSSGDPSLDFLLGVPSTFSQGTGAIIQADAFLNYFYGQDQWKVAKNLTVDVGLGYSIDTPLRNHQYNGIGVACFILGGTSKTFPGAPTGLLFPGDTGCSTSAQATTRYSEFGPRFGFAYSPNAGFLTGGAGKTSIRGGFGIYYNRTEEESALQTLGTPPFGFTSNGAQDFGGSPSFLNPYADINGGVSASGGTFAKSENNRFPFTQPVAGQKIDFSQFGPIYNISNFDKSFRAPYSENFQLSIERELPFRQIARISYVGALRRHNQVTYEGNPVTSAGQAACLASPACVADRNNQALDYPSHTIANNPNFVSIGEVGSYSSSNYNSLQASVTKSESFGLAYQISYTYAHAMDDASSFENSGFGSNGQRGYNQFNKQLNYGDSTFDARHHFVFAPVYVSPKVGHGNALTLGNLALAGWEIGTISTFATGLPFDISYAGTTSRSLYCSANVGFYACPDVPLQTAPLTRGNLRAKISGGVSAAFLPTGFAAEPIGSFGDVHRNPYHGPGSINTDATIAKNLILTESIRLQLRLSTSNVFNHTNFNNPSSLYGSTTFGRVTGAAAGRATQLAAKIYF